MPPTRADFTAFANALTLRHFSADEILANVGPHENRPENPVPEETLWANIAPTILLLDALRAELGASITINSGYRAPDYNRAIGGTARSQHQDFRALDFRCAAGTPDEWATIIRLWRVRPFTSPVPLPVVPVHAPLELSGLRVSDTAQGTAFVYAGKEPPLTDS